MLRLALAVMLFTTLAAAADDDPGAALYRQKACHTCHGADGSANTPAGRSLKARDLRSKEVQRQSDDELASVISDGKGKMPSFKSAVTPEQIRHIVAHIRRMKQ